MTEPFPSNAEIFSGLINDLAKSSHGSSELKAIKGFLDKDLKKTAAREKFLLPLLTRSAIRWEEVKASVWNSEEEMNLNHFPFLQGDIISTSLVLTLGMAQTQQQHKLWLVLSPDCDCVRSRFVRVAPVFPVLASAAPSDVEPTRFGHSLRLSSPKAFPIPPLPKDIGSGVRGYFADFDEPCFIEQDSKNAATV